MSRRAARMRLGGGSGHGGGSRRGCDGDRCRGRRCVFVGLYVLPSRAPLVRSDGSATARRYSSRVPERPLARILLFDRGSCEAALCRAPRTSGGGLLRGGRGSRRRGRSSECFVLIHCVGGFDDALMIVGDHDRRCITPSDDATMTVRERKRQTRKEHESVWCTSGWAT